VDLSLRGVYVATGISAVHENDRQDESVSEFLINAKPCRDINAETEPTRCRMLLQLAAGTKQPQ